jgi:fatty-acyl-CoA synthase
MVEQVRPECPDLTDVVYFGDRSWTALLVGGGRTDHRVLDERMATLSFDDPINIQYTSGSPRVPRCRITTFSTTATSSAR